MTKERLRKYRDLVKEQARIRRKIETLESTLYSPKAQKLTGMPASPSGCNSMEDLAAKHIELLAHYKEKEAELAAEQLAIEQAISSLDYRERTIMGLYYIDGLSWEEVCARMKYSWRQTHRIHSKALGRLREEPED